MTNRIRNVWVKSFIIYVVKSFVFSFLFSTKILYVKPKPKVLTLHIINAGCYIG